ncbi:hypothetical protein [Paraburkholderia lacunae]|uniref:hypothetical protein n=1 Tax=Paraburkholderia lacunae TaxID=2211104 RepID=UPI0010590869|nr:hypothetical protein [Paraburkholderia lacunae]
MTDNIRLTVLARAAFVAGLILFGTKVASAEATLCQSHEEVYFSCPTDGKVLSVCASGNISPDNGYVQYRFGRVGRIELEYPEKPYPPRKLFSISHISGGNLSFTHFKFSSRGYHYVLYQGDPSGIYIKRNGKVVSNRICDPGTYQPISPRVFRGVKTVPPIDGIDN